MNIIAIQKLKSFSYRVSAVVTALVLSNPASAALKNNLPKTDKDIIGSGFSSSNNFFEIIQRGIDKGGQLVGLALALVGFIWVGYSAFQSYKEWSDGRASASDVAAKVAIGAGLIIFVAFLMGEADKVNG